MTIKRVTFGLTSLLSLGVAIFIVVDNIRMRNEGFPVPASEYGDALIFLISSAIMAGCAYYSGSVKTTGESPQQENA